MLNTFYRARYLPMAILFLLSGIFSVASPLFAQDENTLIVRNFSVPASFLTVRANIRPDRMSISYNGLSNTNGLLFQASRDPYEQEPLNEADMDIQAPLKDAYLFKVGRKVQEITQYLLRYFYVDESSKADEDEDFKIKSRVNTNQADAGDFEFNLSLNVGYDTETFVQVNAIKLESFCLQTYVTAIYHYEENQIEFGLSSAVVNNYLFDGMTLEFQANPGEASGAILLSMRL